MVVLWEGLALGTRVTSFKVKVPKLTPDLSETITIKYERGEVDQTGQQIKQSHSDVIDKLDFFIWNKKLCQNQSVNGCKVRLGVKSRAGLFWDSKNFL